MSDITYIPTREGWLYLAIVIDLISRAILGWKIDDSLHSEVVTGALQHALKTGCITGGAIFHSDRRCQYAASSTRDLLHKHELLQSMSAAGNCYDNAFAESAFASLKAELPDAEQPFPSKQAARLAIFDYIETFYNRRRRHTSLGSISPFDYLKINFTIRNNPLNQPVPDLSTFPGDFHSATALQKQRACGSSSPILLSNENSGALTY